VQRNTVRGKAPDVTITSAVWCRLQHRPLLTPSKIGYQHGQAAKFQITRCIEFYACLFLKNCKQRWPQVLEHAAKFAQLAQDKWPAYHEEMQGIADGAGRELLDIVALNVRTEINFGLFSDGCTALAWHTEKRAWLAQNWDVSIKDRRSA
jgi:isopenicillin-N N-acyltransferase-like protein